MTKKHLLLSRYMKSGSTIKFWSDALSAKVKSKEYRASGTVSASHIKLWSGFVFIPLRGMDELVQLEREANNLFIVVG